MVASGGGQWWWLAGQAQGGRGGFGCWVSPWWGRRGVWLRVMEVEGGVSVCVCVCRDLGKSDIGGHIVTVGTW